MKKGSPAYPEASCHSLLPNAVLDEWCRLSITGLHEWARAMHCSADFQAPRGFQEKTLHYIPIHLLLWLSMDIFLQSACHNLALRSWHNHAIHVQAQALGFLISPGLPAICLQGSKQCMHIKHGVHITLAFSFLCSTGTSLQSVLRVQ